MKSSRFLFRLPCCARAGLKIDNSDSHSRDDSAARVSNRSRDFGCGGLGPASSQGKEEPHEAPAQERTGFLRQDESTSEW